MANPANSTAYRGQDGRMWVDVTEAKTLGIADSGLVQNVIYASAVITLPATATQGVFIVRNGGLPVNSSGPAGATMSKNSVAISPNASDKIQGGPTGTATDDKDMINTAATAQVGDEMVVINTGETNGGIVGSYKGIWAREA